MKFAALSISPVLLLMAGLTSTPLFAADATNGAIVRINAVTSLRLAVYERAANDSKLKELEKESVKMPLEVYDTSEDERFLKVKIDGDIYWIRSAQVSILRAVTAGCLAQNAASIPAGAIRGGNRGCAK